MATLDDLNPEQRARLLEYARVSGPCWKTKLNEAWLSGKDASMRDGHLLRQIRNQRGPVWLHSLSIPKEVLNPIEKGGSQT